MSKPQKPYLVLENLFNSKVRVKMLKFFFRSYPVNAGIRDLSKRIQEPLAAVKKEIKDLERIGLIKKL